jgi:hypothetical protein
MCFYVTLFEDKSTFQVFLCFYRYRRISIFGPPYKILKLKFSNLIFFKVYDQISFQNAIMLDSRSFGSKVMLIWRFFEDIFWVKKQFFQKSVKNSVKNRKFVFGQNQEGSNLNIKKTRSPVNFVDTDSQRFNWK